MLQATTPSIRHFNNDNMPHFAQFQARIQAAQARQASLEQGSAAVGLQSAPPKPAQLDDAQAQHALQSVQDSAGSVSSMHKGLDPERVARLLGLLD